MPACCIVMDGLGHWVGMDELVRRHRQMSRSDGLETACVLQTFDQAGLDAGGACVGRQVYDIGRQTRIVVTGV